MMAPGLGSAAHIAAVVLLLQLLVAAATDDLTVTCGSTIKLMHVATGYRLHSHEVAYGRGSQQQSVTGFPTGDDGNSMWVVMGTKTEPCQPGKPVGMGSKLRLQHVATRKWLHSHAFASPLSGNQEVSCFGGPDESDTGDVWIIEWDSHNSEWKQSSKVRFKHVDTHALLYSHEHRFQQPIAGQQEVCCKRGRDRNSDWQAAEGVYIPKDEALPGGKDEL